jgi:hypothetical protein
MVVATGNYGRLAFSYETTYGGSVETDTSGIEIYHDLGYGAKLTGVNSNRNTRVLYNIGSPFGKKMAALQYEGTFGVDGILTNDNLFEAIFGEGSKTEVDSNGDTVIDTNEYAPKYHPKSFTLQYGYSGDENILVDLKGCLIKSASVSARINEPIRYKINCVFQKQLKSNPTSIDPVDPTEVAVPTFVDADLTFMGQSFLVQDFSVNLDLGANTVYGLGSAFTQDMYRGRLAVNGSLTVLAQKDDILDLMYSLGWSSTGITEPVDSSTVNETNNTTFTLGIDDNGDGVADRSFGFTITGVAIDKIGQDLEAGEMVLYSIDYVALLADASYKFA